MSHEPPDPFADSGRTFTEPDHYSAPAAWGEARKATHGDADERLSPPPRPTPGQLERDVRAAVVHAAVRFCHEAPVDEVRLLAELLRRIESGRKAYGAWSAAGEKRDLIHEEHEEHLDALVYSSMRRVMGRRP